MELTDKFHVPVDIDRAWSVLTDVERIAPCMPGAQLEEVEGNEYRGAVKIKVGPITAQYKGKATFLEKDDANHVAKLKGEGRDSKGQGNASVIVTMTLTSSPTGGTDVTIHNDLNISGKIAQFARASVVTEISGKLLGQFVQCLEHDVLSAPEEIAADIAAASAAATGSASVEAPTGATTESSAAANTGGGSDAASSAVSSSAPGSGTEAKPGVRKIEYKEAEPVDLLNTAGTPIVKRAAPVAAIVFLLVWLLRRSKR